MELSGRTALVSGASRGIGRAIAIELATRGADVGLVQRGKADQTRAAVISLGRRVATVQADLADAAAAQAAVTRVHEELGGLDVLVCNAAEVVREDALTVPVDTWRRLIDVDLVSAFVMARTAAQLFTAGSGAVVFVSSVLGFQGGIKVSAYAAAKAALVNLTRSLANEWASSGIRVNAVAPGYIITEQTSPLRADAHRKAEIDGRIPAGRWGSTEEVAQAVAFLVGPGASYVHGHTLVVDGGWLAR